MAQYALVKDGVITNLYDSIPRSLGNDVSGFQLLNDEERQAFGFYKVVQSNNEATYNPQLHNVTRSDHELIDGIPTRIFEYVDKYSEDELITLKKNKFWNDVRDYRNQLLNISDWALMPDVSATKGETWTSAWIAYRQQLRDITSNESLYDQYQGEAKNVQYPSEPQV